MLRTLTSYVKLLLALIGILAPNLRMLDGVTRPTINTSGNSSEQVSAMPFICTDSGGYAKLTHKYIMEGQKHRKHTKILELMEY